MSVTNININPKTLEKSAKKCYTTYVTLLCMYGSNVL